MDRSELLAAAPKDADWHDLPEIRRKGAALDFIEAIISGIEFDGRDADAWEGFHLQYACGAVLGGMYTLAVVAAEKSLALPEERAERPWPHADQCPSIERLREILQYVRAFSRS